MLVMVATLDLGRAKFATPQLVVPLGAIVSPPDGEKTFSVFVVLREGEREVARRRTVQPGATFGNMVSMAKGVSLGEQVISNGAAMVNDGQVVRIIP